MELAVWTYEGPTHMGALRVATAMRGVHCLLHAPQGDSYADLLFTMIERRPGRPPVSYTSFQQRDLGRSTADLIKEAARAAYERFHPEVLLIGESCTAELLQDQAGSLVRGLGLPVPVLPLDLPSWSRKETWGAGETFHRLVRALLKPRAPAPGASRPARAAGQAPRANLLGPIALGFRCRDDVTAVSRLLAALGVEVNVVAPLGARPTDLLRLPEADFNICLYPEIAESTCAWLERTFRQPWVRTVPIGIGATREFLAEVARLANEPDVTAAAARLAGSAAASPPGGVSASGFGLETWTYAPRLPWYSQSVDATYLTGKRVFIFGDATHALAAARIVDQELGMRVVGMGTYLREQARPVREAAQSYGLEALITADYLEVEAAIADSHPELVLGTQMERHVAKRLGIPCAVISGPAHVQDFPARYAPQMGFEGADVIFDTWIGPLMMGLEEHLLTMFRGDFEFDEEPAHLARSQPLGGAKAVIADAPSRTQATVSAGHGNGGGSPAPVPTGREPAAGEAMGQPSNAVSGGLAATLPALDPAQVPSPSVAVPPKSTSPSDGLSPSAASPTAVAGSAAAGAVANEPIWDSLAENELKKIPFFVRGKARRNTECFARERGIATITVETLYDAKAHFGR